MTISEFNRLWESGKEVYVDFGVHVDRNYHSFPEKVTAEHTEGTFFGIHFAFQDIPVFSIEHELCMFDIEIVDLNVSIESRKESHGEHVYAIKMIGDEVFPVLEVEYGREWRALGTRCIIRKVEL